MNNIHLCFSVAFVLCSHNNTAQRTNTILIR